MRQVLSELLPGKDRQIVDVPCDPKIMKEVRLSADELHYQQNICCCSTILSWMGNVLTRLCHLR